MKKGNTIWWIVGSAAALIGFSAIVFLTRKKAIGPDQKGGEANPNTTTTGTGEIIVDNTKPSGSAYEHMGFVQKSNTPLVSILKGPMLFSGKLKDVESFTSIYARPSSKSGWWEVSDDGVTTIGYVPNGTLRKL